MTDDKEKPMTAPAVVPGYKIGRQDGLTKREREVLSQLALGLDMPRTGEALGISKQRVSQIVKALEGKGALVRDEATGTITITIGRKS